MANIFTLDKFDDFTEKIDLDELYENKKNNDLQKLALFQKMLHRVHVKIKQISKQSKGEHFCWYIVPEIMIGVPKYDQAGCIAYLIDKLKENKFQVQYYHPNTLFINWSHWVPSYIRNEYKKKTGITINEIGEQIHEEKKEEISLGNLSNLLLTSKQDTNKNNKKFTPIQEYIPSGDFY